MIGNWMLGGSLVGALLFFVGLAGNPGLLITGGLLLAGAAFFGAYLSRTLTVRDDDGIIQALYAAADNILTAAATVSADAVAGAIVGIDGIATVMEHFGIDIGEYESDFRGLCEILAKSRAGITNVPRQYDESGELTPAYRAWVALCKDSAHMVMESLEVLLMHRVMVTARERSEV